MSIRFRPLPTATVRALQAGGADAYGFPPERRLATSGGMPCRHCLRHVPQGEDYLVLAHRPFATLQPYAETGPIFLCAAPCPAGDTKDSLPPFLTSPAYILRGYDADERIIYGTGSVTARDEILARCAALLADDGVAFVHIRSASNNCFHVRAERSG